MPDYPKYLPLPRPKHQEKKAGMSESGLVSEARAPLTLLLLLAAVFSLYWIGRYGGYAMEVDASRMTQSAGGILKVGHLVHEKSYPPGYEYPALLAILSKLTGLSIQILQLNAGLWLPVLALVAYLSYRELLGDPNLAVLTCLLLLIQPDFTFYILRSSHEKITWMLALCSLFCLARSNRFARVPARMLLFEALFCLVFWAMATTNAYFALVFLAGLTFYWLGTRIICRRISWQGTAVARRCQLVRRAGVICLIGYGLVFIVINFAYPPAVNFYQTLNSFAEHVRGLISGEALKQPYAYLGSAWRHPLIYLALTLPQWTIVLAGLLGWGMGARRLGQANQSGWLLWLLYAAFAAMLVAGVIMDFAGFLSLNLQLRLFPPFALAGSPFAARAISRGFEKVLAAKSIASRILGVGLGVYAVLAAMAKVTNEPLLSNQWLFYSPAELQAVRWTDAHLESHRVWSDTSSHLADVFGFWEGYGGPAVSRYEFGVASPSSSHVLISRWTRLQANRNGVSLPATLEHDRVYDNGMVQLYHRRPKTPYQR
jgi:hypothetical protein